MNGVETIIAGMDGNAPEWVTTFQSYKIRGHAGKGGQASVFELINPIGKSFAIKFYRPPEDTPEQTRRRIGNFAREVKVLATLNHKNIVSIVTGGCFRQGSEEWEVQEGLEGTHPKPGWEYFYIMEYIPVSLMDILPLFESNPTESSTKLRNFQPADRVRLFEKLIRHVCDALARCHKEELAHQDIKAENVLYREQDETFVLADFGQARHLDSLSPSDPIRKWPHNNPTLLWERAHLENDIFAVSLLLEKLLRGLEKEYDPIRYAALLHIIQKAQPHGDSAFPFEDALDFKRSLERYFIKSGWSLRLQNNEFLVPPSGNRFVINGKIRLPVSGSIFLTREVRRIIDSKDFQRLRGVRQLGPTAFVFPGANHTRFEHSLGTYNLALRYLETLTKIPIFNDYCQPIDRTIKITTLAALLHDIGHYPYSHWIEEIGRFPQGLHFPTHEQRAKDIILNGSLQHIIREDWGVEPEAVIDMIIGGSFSGTESIIRSMVDSILDFDKLDYLIRDSIHCGVDYGRGLDVQRFLEALYVSLDDTAPTICLTDKGRTYLMSLFTSRNVMYKEVYWHKTVRACTAMFKHFFHAFISQELLDDSRDNVLETMNTFFRQPDDTFVWSLYQRFESRCKANPGRMNSGGLELIRPFLYEGRKLYKPAYIFTQGEARKADPAISFFDAIFDADYETILSYGSKLASALRDVCDDITPDDIILEHTPFKSGKEDYDLKEIKIWNLRREKAEDIPDQVGELHKYLSTGRQGYIFCHKKFYSQLNTLAPEQWSAVFRSVLTRH